MKRKILRKTRIVTILSALVVFLTVYSLVLPAVTLTGDAADEDPGISTNETTNVAEVEKLSLNEETSGDVEIETTEQAEEDVQKEEVKEEKTVIENVNYPAVSFSDSLGDMIVYVEAPEGAFPENTLMQLKEVEDEAALVDSINSNLENKEVKAIKAVDIIFIYNNEELEPLKPIKVSMTSSFIESNKEDEQLLVHVDNDNNTNIVETTEVKEEDVEVINNVEEVQTLVENTDEINEITTDNTVAFESDAFSVYAVVYTVDFEYEGYTYSIEGGTSITLSKLFELLGIDDAVEEVKEVTFTDESLIRISRIDGDWILESLKPFESAEELTILLPGKQITISVEDAFTPTGYTDLNSVKTSLNADITAGTEVNYDSNSQEYKASVTMDFIVPTDVIKANKNFYLELSDDVEIPENALGIVKYAIDQRENMKSFNYHFEKGDNGKYYVVIEYLDAYLDQVSIINKNTINMNLLVGELSMDGEDKAHFDFIDGLPINVDPTTIDYPHNENKDSNINADKTYINIGTENRTIDGETKTVSYVDYSITVSSTKGTGEDITLTDVMNGLSLKFNYYQEQDISVSDIVVQNVLKDGASITQGDSVTDGTYTFAKGVDNKSFTMGLKEIGEGGGTYTVTYRYYLNREIPSELDDSQTHMKASGNNSVTVEAGDIYDNDSSSFEIEKTNQPVSINKSGQFNSNTGKIEWTITLFLKAGNHDLFDELFASANDSLTITREEGTDFTYTQSSDKKTIHFNDPGTYTIRYTTDADQDMYSSIKVANTAKVDNNDSYKKDTEVNVPSSGQGNVEKELLSSTLVSSTDNIETYNLTWEVSFTLPEKLPKGTVLRDTLSLVHSNSTYFTFHSFSDAQKSELIAQLEEVFGTNAFDIVLNENNTYELVLTLKDDWTKPESMANSVSLSYSTTATVDLSFANPGVSNQIDKDRYINTFKIGDISASANFPYSKEVNKIDPDYRDGTKLTKHTITKDANELKWAVIVNLGDDYNQMTITDTLPSGITPTKVYIGGEYNQDVYDVAKREFEGYPQYIYQNVKSITVNGTDLIVNLEVDSEDNRSSFFKEGERLYVEIHADVDESEFDPVATISKSYTNNVSVSGDGKPLGSDHQTQEVSLDSQSVSKSTVKSAIGDLDTADEEWSTYHYLSYGVVINEDGHTMNNGEPYSMEDVLSFKKTTSSGKDVNFMLVPGSVKLQSKNADGEWVNLSEDSWKYQYIETKDGDMRYKTISVSELPDNQTLRLVYTYQVDVPDSVKGESYDIGNITNTATIHGASDYSIEHHEHKNWEQYSSDASTESSNSLVLSKVDLSNYNVLLPGTKFVLEKWNGTNWEVVDAISQENIYLATETDPSKIAGSGTDPAIIYEDRDYAVYQTATTSNNKRGSLRFYMPINDTSVYSGKFFEAGVCYRAREYEAPTGGYYVESNPEAQPAAYFWFSQSHDGTKTYTRDQVAWPAYNPRIKNISDDLSTESDTFYITNAKKPSIKVSKKFQGDADISESQKKAMIFDVYWTGEDGEISSDDLLVKSLSYDEILKNKNVITSDDSPLIQNGRSYYVVEHGIDALGTEWSVTYAFDTTEEFVALEPTTEFSHETTVSSGTFIIENNVGNIEFVNKYDSIKTSINVTKTWVDYQDNIIDNPSVSEIKFQVYQLKEGETEGSLYVPKGEEKAQTYTVDFDASTKTWERTEITGLPLYYVEEGSQKEYTYYAVEASPSNSVEISYSKDGSSYSGAVSSATNDPTEIITIKNKEIEPPHFSVTKQWFDFDGETDYTSKTDKDKIYFKVFVNTEYSSSILYNPVTAHGMNSDPSIFNEEKNYFIINKQADGWSTIDIRFPNDYVINNGKVTSFYLEEVDENGNPVSDVNPYYFFDGTSFSSTQPVEYSQGDLGNAVITNIENPRYSVTKKWLGSDGSTDIGSVVDQNKVYFAVYYSYNNGGNEFKLDQVYSISRNNRGIWETVELESLADDPQRWGSSAFDGYYIVETDENGNPLKNTSLITYTINDKSVSKDAPIAASGFGVITITNRTEEKPGEIEVIKKWKGDFADTEKTANIQLKRVKRTTGDSANVTVKHAWGQPNIYLQTTSQYSNNKPIYIGDTVKLSMNLDIYDGGYVTVSGASDIVYNASDKTLVFTVTESDVVFEINTNPNNSVSSVECVRSDYDDSSSVTPNPESVGEEVTLSSNNNWYYKWTDLSRGYTYFVEETNKPGNVAVEYKHNNEAVPVNGINQGLITITNTKEESNSGSLRLKKFARINGFDPADETNVSVGDKTKADGEYTIDVVNANDASISYAVKITIENGAPKSATVNDDDVDLSDDEVILKDLVPGNYIVTERKDTRTVCTSIICSDQTVVPSLEERKVIVPVLAGEEGNTAKLVTYYNTYSTTEVDVSHLSVRKTFKGIARDKLPGNFIVSGTIKVNEEQDPIPVKLNNNPEQPSGISFVESEKENGDIIWEWKISIRGLTENSMITLTESNYSIDGYTVITNVNGVNNITEVTDANINPGIVINDFVTDEETSNNRLIFPVKDSETSATIFIARLTSDQTALVISKNKLNLSERTKIEYHLKHEMKHASDWTHGNQVLYYSFEEASNNKIYVKGSTVTYSDTDGGQIKFDQKCQWSMVAEGTITYQPGRPADFNFVNTYSEEGVGLQVTKVDAENKEKTLSGARFTITLLNETSTGDSISYKTKEDGSPVYQVESDVTGQDGKISFTGLEQGYYEVKETTVPSGYILVDEGTFYIHVSDGRSKILTKDASKTIDQWTANSILNDGGNISFNGNESVAVASIGNTPGSELPHTGGPGINMIKLFGTVVMFAAIAAFLERKKRK